MFGKAYKMIKDKCRKTDFEKQVDDQNLPQEIPKSTKALLELLSCTFGDSLDFVYREITLDRDPYRTLIVAYINGLVNKEMLNGDVLRPLTKAKEVQAHYKNDVELLKNHLLYACKIEEEISYREAVKAILAGDAVVFIEEEKRALKINVRGWEKRGIEEPPTDAVVRGPREGFTESLITNTSMIRRKIKNSMLRFEKITVGEQTNTDICICFLKGIANDEVVDNVRNKLKSIQTDAILESGYIEEFIENEKFCIFPTVGNTEKPDIVAGKLLEGRVAILCDGTPFVLTVPYLFVEAIQSSEDYYFRSIYATFNRMLRVFALLITTLLPAYYVALVTFHQDTIPYKLLITMTASREGLPFSALIEALLMVITFELLREAGIRMPRAIGQAVSIVGALVIGDAAVKAGLVSTPMVIVIAVTAISSFIVTPLAGALLIVRIVTMIAASIIGILGILLVCIIIFTHLASVKSFGVNYLSPLTPLSGMDLKDTFVRFPIWAMFTRPSELVRKQKNAQFREAHSERGKTGE